VAWNGSLWVAVGQGTYSIAYSHDGITWIGAATTIFSNGGSDVAWNGSLWVAVGDGAGGNTIATSTDGITWIGQGSTVMTAGGPIIWNGISVAWNGSLWIAVGNSNNPPTRIATSTDGIHWFGSTSTQTLFGIAFNSRRPYTLTFPTNSTSSIIGIVSSSVSFPISVLSTSRLDVVSDAYYNGGYTNFSITMNASRS